jgi:hypothetical protein
MSLIDLAAAVSKAFPISLRAAGYSELRALDDHSLADIGLHRSTSKRTPLWGDAQHRPDLGDLSFLLWW